MTTPQSTATGVPISVAIEISKGGVNSAKRTVRGLMTQEVVDSHGEEVDFESVKSCLTSWRGNVREMHQPRAVGKAVEIVTLDDLKAIEVAAYVSKGAEDTWQKCLDGTLAFYSLGGTADRVIGQRSDGTTGPRLIMRKLNELSLVDSGACPTSTISVVKMVDGTPVEQLGDVVERTEHGDAAQRTDATTDSTRAADAPDTANVQLDMLGGVLKGLGFRSERWNITNALGVVACLEELISEQCYESMYSDTAPDNASQVSLLRIAAEILIDFIATEFEQQFAGDAIANLSDAQQTVVKAVIEKRGARHSRNDNVMLQGMHDNCVKLGATCGVEKMDDTKTEQTTAVESTQAATETPAAAIAAIAQPTEKAADAPAATPSSDAPAATTTTTGVPPAATVDVAAIVTEAVTKAVDGVRSTFDTKLAEQKATSDAAIATLQEQVTKLSNEPASGGPVANAHAAIVIEKDGSNIAQAMGDPAVARGVITKLEELASTEADPGVRQSLVEKALALRMQHGVGAVPVQSALR